MFILQSQIIRELVNTLIDMGIMVHMCTDLLSDELWEAAKISRMGRYTALTRSLKTVSAGEMTAKRAMNIVGSLVDCGKGAEYL